MATALTYTDAAAQVLDLNDGVTYLTEAVDGAGISGLQHRTVKTPNRDGETYIDTLLEPRFVLVTVVLLGDTWVELQTARRDLVRALNPKLGVGTLTYTPDTPSPVYALRCLPEAGIGFTDRLGGFLDRVAINFHAFEPSWYNPTANTPTIVVPGGGLSIPLSIPMSISENAASIVIDNTGDLQTYPSFSLPGPFVDPVIANETTGKQLLFDGLSVASGETLVVDMAERTAEVDGVSVIAKVHPTSEFWALATGNNTVEVTYESGASTVTVTWFTRFLGL